MSHDEHHDRSVLHELGMIQHFAREILLKLGDIHMTQEEAVTALNAVNDTLTKIGGETSALLAEIELLKQAASGNVSPEVEAAINAVAARATTVDDLVPDAPPAEPPAETPPTA